MPDICDLILDDHERFRRRFAELDNRRRDGAEPDRLQALWQPLADLLETHASAEEDMFYPRLLERGDNAEEETEDAVSDHNDIREAVRRAAGQEPGSAPWWQAVLDAREENSDHMAEEEREALPDFRENVADGVRDELGDRWLAFRQEHAGARGLDLDQVDVEEYVDQHG